MIYMPNGAQCLYDSEGTLRVRMGDLTVGIPVDEIYHLTMDGEYVTGELMGKGAHSTENLNKFRNTYAGCQGWCKSQGDWYTIPAAGIGYARWEGISEKDVPECVRMAELVR